MGDSITINVLVYTQNGGSPVMYLIGLKLSLFFTQQ